MEHTFGKFEDRPVGGVRKTLSVVADPLAYPLPDPEENARWSAVEELQEVKSWFGRNSR